MELDPPEYNKNNNNILLNESFVSVPDQYNGNMKRSNTTTYLIIFQTLV
jgi:hypothetical protein